MKKIVKHLKMVNSRAFNQVQSPPENRAQDTHCTCMKLALIRVFLNLRIYRWYLPHSTSLQSESHICRCLRSNWTYTLTYWSAGCYPFRNECATGCLQQEISLAEYLEVRCDELHWEVALATGGPLMIAQSRSPMFTTAAVKHHERCVASCVASTVCPKAYDKRCDPHSSQAQDSASQINCDRRVHGLLWVTLGESCVCLKWALGWCWAHFKTSVMTGLLGQ